MYLKRNSKHAIVLPVPILTRVLLRDLSVCDHTKFQPNDTQTDDCCWFSIDKAYSVNGRNAVTETPKMAEPYFRSQI